MRIPKYIIEQILDVYKVNKKEFTAFGNKHSLSFMSGLIKGYMITIKPEEINGHYSGNILVTHTDETGKITYIDTWKKEDKKVIFFARDTLATFEKKPNFLAWEDAEEEIKSLKDIGKKLLKENEFLKQEIKKLKEK